MAGGRYFRPESIKEAISIYGEHPQGTLMAGGTDLMVGVAKGRRSLETIVDLKSIGEIDEVYQEGTFLRIGAMTTVTKLEETPVVRGGWPFLAKAAGCLGSWQVRNWATVGGNLCHGAPSAELATPLLALGAWLVLVSPEGERKLPLKEFFQGPGKTSMGPGEILKEIIVPKVPEKSRGVYVRHQLRQSMDIAIINLTALVVEKDGRIEESRIYLGAAAPIPMEGKETEEVLKGKVLSESLILEAAEKAAKEARPITDIRASEEYRRRMIKVNLERALRMLMEERVGEDERSR